MDEGDLFQVIDKNDFKLDHLTSKLPANLTSDYLLEYKNRLESLLSAVTKKVSELILSHQPAYVEELKRIADLQESITCSIRACTQGRACLRLIKDANTTTIVEHQRKRESLAKLLESLTAISEIRALVLDIRALIDSQDFPKAIKMCKDGKILLSSFQQYKCVNELGSKLDDTFEFIGEQVDTVMSRICLSYDSVTYAKLQTTYALMDRSEVAIDQLLMHFCSVINSQAYDIVMKHLDQTTALESKRDLHELCRMLTKEQFMFSLIEICATYQLIIYNYKEILKWHDQEIKIDELKLTGGTNRLWYDMKRKLCLLLSTHDFSGYIFDEFIKILDVVDALMKTGDEFCGGDSSSNELVDCINNQALNFFKAYHKSSVDELKMFLDNELWEAVPVKTDFKLVQLREFSFLRSVPDVEPFSYEDTITLDKISLSTDSDEDLDKDFVEEDDSPSSKITTSSGPTLTNSSLNVIRLFGRYIQMMRILKLISYEILTSIYDLLDQYTYAAYKKFAPNVDIRVVIRSIRESLMSQEVPNLNTLADHRDSSKKAVAIDSLIFLVNQLWNLQEYLESLISIDMRSRLREEFTQYQSTVPKFLKARAELSSGNK